VRLNNLRQIRLASTNFDYSTSLSVYQLHEKHGGEWINYPVGVINEFIGKRNLISGLDMLFSGDIPNGAGLSSSASIEMVTAFALNDIFKYGWSMIDLIKASKKAENEFVGVNCGIMDQFAVGMAKSNHALFLNCDTLEYEMVPLELGNHVLLISNTKKNRGLTDSKYNERVAQCQKALDILKQHVNIRNLGQLSLDTFTKYELDIPEEVIRRRARHVVSENQRVLNAVLALKKKDLAAFGAYMNASHDSLRYDYEVTGIELDTLVEESRKVEGVLGSRMTGAGFGGCSVTLIRKDKYELFCAEVEKQYHKKTGLIPEFYTVTIGDGVRRID
jgi:galactokinase